MSLRSDPPVATPAPMRSIRRSDPRSPWRLPLAAASVIAAAAHVPVTGEHLHEAFYIGLLFILLEVAAVALAVAVLIRPGRTVHLAIAVVGALAVLALVLSRTVGLPLIGDDVGNWAEPLAVVSLVAELLMVVGGCAAAAGRPRTTPRARLVGVLVAGLILVSGAASIGVASLAAPADDDHSGGMDPGMHGMVMGRDAAMVLPEQ